jgi:predicted deacylase
LKNTHIALFTVGIIMGGAMMFILLGFLRIQTLSLSHQTVALTPTAENPPYLIALEPTHVQRAATPTPVPPVVTIEASLPSRQMAGSPTPTSLVLLNGRRPEMIGDSVEGRPLEVYTFGDGEQERMIVAGIHGGDEWNTVTLANQLIRHLDQNPNLIPDDITLYILPALNPDGEARAHNKYGRLNHNGVDLNRNFPVNWKRDWDRGGCWNYLPTSGGTSPGSEVETQVLMNFINNHHIQVLISYHSAALGLFPGGLPWDDDSSRFAESLARVSSYPFPPLDTGCAYSGTLADYAVSAGMAAVDLELTNHFDTDFDQNLQVLDVLLNFVP